MDDKQTKQRITITIANRSYPFEIEYNKLETQEPLARGAAEEIKERYEKYLKLMEKSPKSDIQDMIALAAWDIAYDYLALKGRRDADTLIKKIAHINNRLEKCLQETSDNNRD